MPAARPDGEGRLRRRRGSLLPFGLAVLAIVLVAAGAVTYVLSPNWGGRRDGADRDVGSTRGAGLAALVRPRAIVIPRLHEQAPVVSVRNDASRALDIPENPTVVGWWDGGVKPGAARGTAVLAGHVNFNGVQGALARIGDLNPGNRVVLTGTRRGNRVRVAFRVTGVRTFSKEALPYARIFRQRGPGRLALVTCGGPFDSSTGNYQDNVVAFAVVARDRHAHRHRHGHRHRPARVSARGR